MPKRMPPLLRVTQAPLKQLALQQTYRHYH
jgi:hypothetical protein